MSLTFVQFYFDQRNTFSTSIISYSFITFDLWWYLTKTVDELYSVNKIHPNYTFYIDVVFFFNESNVLAE